MQVNWRRVALLGGAIALASAAAACSTGVPASVQAGPAYSADGAAAVAASPTQGDSPGAGQVAGQGQDAAGQGPNESQGEGDGPGGGQGQGGGQGPGDGLGQGATGQPPAAGPGQPPPYPQGPPPGGAPRTPGVAGGTPSSPAGHRPSGNGSAGTTPGARPGSSGSSGPAAKGNVPATLTGTTTTPSPVPAPAPTVAPPPPPFLCGWYSGNNKFFDVAAFASLPVKPAIANYYSGWGERFKADFARAAAARGMTTYVEMEPWHCGDCGPGGHPSMTDIAVGKYDAYLTRFGAQIRAYGSSVLVTFAHEMNGYWYPWGNGGSEGVTPAQWIAAWDHVVTVVNQAAPGLVTWVWAPNVTVAVGPVTPYWPGDQYVNLVGIDGYLRADTDTYDSIVAPTVAEIRTLTSKPIWIAETGLNIDATTGTRLAAYVAAIRAAGLRGLLYFNKAHWALPPGDLDILASALKSPAS